MARSRRDEEYDDDDEYDEDDFEDELPRRPARRSAPRPAAGGNAAVKIIAILGAVFAFVVIVCAGVGIYVYTSFARGVNDMQQKAMADMEKHRERMKADAEESGKKAKQWQADQARQKEEDTKTDKGQATAAAAEFFQMMRDGRTDEAYRMTTPAYQKRTTQAEFEKQIEARKKVITWTLSSARDNDVFGPKSGSSFRFLVHSPWGSISFSMAKAGDRWLASAIDFAQ